MKKLLILTTCLLSRLFATSIAGDQDDVLSGDFSSAVTVSSSKAIEDAPLAEFTVPGGWGDKDISDWQSQSPGFIRLRALTFKMFDSSEPYDFRQTFNTGPRSAKGIASFVQCAVLESLSFGNFFNVTAYDGAVKKVIMQFSNLQSLHLGNVDISGDPKEEEKERKELQATVGEFFKVLPKLRSVSFVLASSVGKYTLELIEKWPEPAFSSYKFENFGGYTKITLSR